MIVPSQLALKTHTNFGCAASFATLDKLVDRFPLPPVVPRYYFHSCYEAYGTFNYTSPTPTAMGQSFKMYSSCNTSLERFFNSVSIITSNTNAIWRELAMDVIFQEDGPLTHCFRPNI
jgi:hypothetical protein